MTAASKPIFSTTQSTSGDQKISGELNSLYGAAQAIIETEDETYTIPAKLLGILSNKGGAVLRDLLAATDNLRREYAGQMSSYGLKPIAENRNKYIPSTYSILEDGVPVIEWRTQKRATWQTPTEKIGETVNGWNLYLSGADEAIIAFAEWDDLPALQNLVNLTQDVDSMFAMAGLMFPEPTAKLSARMSAATLRSARSLPGIDLKKVRDILDRARLTIATGSHERSRGGRISLLKIHSGGKQVPVAVAVDAPSFNASREITDEERQNLSREDLQTLRKSLLSEAADPWRNAARNALVAAGWRQVTLPNPVTSWRSETPVLWFTRIDEHTWELISAAAAEQATSVRISNGGII